MKENTYRYTNETSASFTKNKKYKNISENPHLCTLFIDDLGEYHQISDEYLSNHFELVETKPSKDERITELEKIVKEQGERLKHLETVVNKSPGNEQTNKFIEAMNKPTHPTVDIQKSNTNKKTSKITIDKLPRGLEFEGVLYQKSDKVPHSGDIIIPTVGTGFTTAYNPYKVYQHQTEYCLIINSDHGFSIPVFNDPVRTLDNTAVYEPYTEDIPLTKNQQRKIIIQKAKDYVTGTLKELSKKPEYSNYQIEVNYNHQKNISEALLRHKETGMTHRQSSYSFPHNKTMNKYIGHAIVLAMIILDNDSVNKFDSAVQPDTVVIGHNIRRLSSLEKVYERTVKDIREDKVFYAPYELRTEGFDPISSMDINTFITEDTLAKY